MFLGIDVGGTKVTVAAFAWEEPIGLVLKIRERYRSKNAESLRDILEEFKQANPIGPLDGVGIGVAGPVLDGRVEVTNLPWIIDAKILEAQLRAPVILMNDLEAHGYGISTIGPNGFVMLQKGIKQPGNQALIAAGTGLGQSILFWEGETLTHRPSPSEGGHATFSPCGPLERELAAHLDERLDHVSWERVVSGRDGFRHLLSFLQETDRVALTSAQRQQLQAGGDLGQMVADGYSKGEAFAQVTLDWFVRLYGNVTGNLALTALALGGVFVSGGIAPRFPEAFTDGAFIDAMCAKGRFCDLLRDVPVRLIIDGDVALRGAALRAQTYAMVRGVKPLR